MTEARVLVPRPEDARPLPGPEATVQTLIGPEGGSRQILQREIRLAAGASASPGGPWDDALYVVEGHGDLVSHVRDERFRLRPGTAALVPGKVPAHLHNSSAVERLTLVSVLSPPPFDGVFTAEARVLPLVVTHEDDTPVLPAGEDRTFRVLLRTEYVTQFVGFIDRSKAPPHTHEYEEAIYILEGDGVLHVRDRHELIRPGMSVFMPPGTPHCLENRSPGVLKLLGVFSPPGSPADKVEQA